MAPIQTSNMIDWHTELISGRIVISGQNDNELEWDPKNGNSSNRLQNAADTDDS